MNAKLLSRAIALLILGTILALGLHFQIERRRQAGRGAFITEQQKRWDRVYTRPPQLAVEILVCVFLISLSAGVYELVAAGLCSVIRKFGSNEDPSSR